MNRGIDVRIDELHVHGVDLRGADQFGEALTAELRQLLAARGLQATGPIDIGSVTGSVAGRLGGAALGRSVAATVYDRLNAPRAAQGSAPQPADRGGRT